MEIIRTDEGTWGDKINFVDKNYFVGYDYNFRCCENFGYNIIGEDSIIDTTEDKVEISDMDLKRAYFEGTYLKSNLEEIRFPIIVGEEKYFLVLYNYHNGYYSHNFTFKKNGLNENTIEDSI